jgi:hypothetical protein
LFDRLKYLSLKGRVTDAGLAHVAKLPLLERLYLTGTSVTDTGMKALVGLTKLKVLGLSHTRVGNAGLATLKGGLPELTRLELEDTLVSDPGLEHLKDWSNLDHLLLSCNPHISSAGLAALVGLPLETVSLRRTAIGDKAPPILNKLSRLRDLDLSGNASVSRSGLQQLSGIAKLLIRLVVRDTGITEVELQVFEASLKRATPLITI